MSTNISAILNLQMYQEKLTKRKVLLILIFLSTPTVMPSGDLFVPAKVLTDWQQWWSLIFWIIRNSRYFPTKKKSSWESCLIKEEKSSAIPIGILEELKVFLLLLLEFLKNSDDTWRIKSFSTSPNNVLEEFWLHL